MKEKTYCSSARYSASVMACAATLTSSSTAVLCQSATFTLNGGFRRLHSAVSISEAECMAAHFHQHDTQKSSGKVMCETKQSSRRAEPTKSCVRKERNSARGRSHLCTTVPYCCTRLGGEAQAPRAWVVKLSHTKPAAPCLYSRQTLCTSQSPTL